jgi:hypothetical protein
MRKRRVPVSLATAAWVGLLLASACGTLASAIAPHTELLNKKGISQLEVQQDVQRFSGEFADRLNDAMAPLLRAPNEEVREAALRQKVTYFASALDIATEPQPELSLLDMIVFVTLAHQTLQQYWLPEVYVDAGQPLEHAFAMSEQQIWSLGSKVLDKQNQDSLAALIREWRAHNPNQRSVEAVRFSSFSALEGALSEGDVAKAQGLLATVKSAAAAADAAVLLGNRALFLANRLPFVLRMQARLGSREVVGDAANDLATLPAAIDRFQELRPVIQDLSRLAAQTTTAAEETRRLVDTLRPLLQQRDTTQAAGGGLPRQLDQANELADKSLALMKELESITPKGERDVTRQLDAWMRRSLLYLLGVGAALIALFWLGYYTARRLADDHAAQKTSAGGGRGLKGGPGAGGAQLHPR